MKYIFRAVLIVWVLSIAACSREDSAWEYKVVTVGSEGHERLKVGAMNYSSITPSEADFNLLGKQGWELSSSYLEMETAWANFGKDEYVTGLQPNVRPQRVVFIFKRRQL